MSSSQDYEETERLLRRRLERARRRWQSCKGYDLASVAWAGAANPDSRYFSIHLVPEYRMVLEAYSQALHEWAEFTLHGKVPDWVSDATAA